MLRRVVYVYITSEKLSLSSAASDDSFLRIGGMFLLAQSLQVPVGNREEFSLPTSLTTFPAKTQSQLELLPSNLDPPQRKLENGGASRISETYGNLPLSFEANQGQTDKEVQFLARGSGYTIFLTGNEAVLSLSPHSRGKEKIISRPTIRN